MEKKVALIDGDIIVYEVGFAKPVTGEVEAQTSFSTGDIAASAEEVRDKTWEEVKEHVDDFLRVVKQKTATTHHIGFLSPPTSNNFRTPIAFSREYKGNRQGREKPLWYSELRQYLVEAYGFIEMQTIETDDALAILQTAFSTLQIKSVICTKDKDLKQVSGWNYNWQTADLVKVTHSDAWRMLWKQLLTGDGGDHIIGCGEETTQVYKSGAKEGQEYTKRKGVGPKEAELVLDGVVPGQYPTRVLVEFINRFGLFYGVNKFHESFNLLFLLRTGVQAMFRGEVFDWEAIMDGTPWVNNSNDDEDEEDESF